MNTDTLFTVQEIELLESIFCRVRRSALKDAINWAEFVTTVCNLRGWKYTEVIAHEELVEKLNVLWLRSLSRTKTKVD
jgi:hypothetical protein